MDFPRLYKLAEIAEIVGARYVGAADFPVKGYNEIHVVEKGDIVFVDHPKYYDKALNSQASVVLINKEVDCPEGKALLICEDPFSGFNALTKFFKPFEAATATVAHSASIGEGTVIQPNAFIGNKVVIGKGCTIHSNAAIYDGCVLGDNVTIHSGAILGGDAFYYKKREEGFDKLLSSGSILIGDNVDIGALCTIDKGVTGNTIIGEGTKIDNQVHIGHDTRIGARCLIAAQTGIAGCVIIEDHVTIWGQVGVTSGITIGEKAIVLAQAGVTKSISGGKSYFGTPIQETREKLKEIAEIRQLLKKQKRQ